MRACPCQPHPACPESPTSQRTRRLFKKYYQSDGTRLRIVLATLGGVAFGPRVASEPAIKVPALSNVRDHPLLPPVLLELVELAHE